MTIETIKPFESSAQKAPERTALADNIVQLYGEMRTSRGISSTANDTQADSITIGDSRSLYGNDSQTPPAATREGHGPMLIAPLAVQPQARDIAQPTQTRLNHTTEYNPADILGGSEMRSPFRRDASSPANAPAQGSEQADVAPPPPQAKNQAKADVAPSSTIDGAPPTAPSIDAAPAVNETAEGVAAPSVADSSRNAAVVDSRQQEFSPTGANDSPPPLRNESARADRASADGSEEDASAATDDNTDGSNAHAEHCHHHHHHERGGSDNGDASGANPSDQGQPPSDSPPQSFTPDQIQTALADLLKDIQQFLASGGTDIRSLLNQIMQDLMRDLNMDPSQPPGDGPQPQPQPQPPGDGPTPQPQPQPPGDGPTPQPQPPDQPPNPNPGDHPLPPEPNPNPKPPDSGSGDIATERSQLQADATKEIADPTARQTFLNNMEKFEARAKQDGVSDAEVAKTYASARQLMDAQGGKIPQDERVGVAEEIMMHAADPSSVDQGMHKTCNVATLENRTFALHPSVAADMITSAALTGQWTAPDGKVIKIDDQSLVPGAEERNYPPRDGARSHASQLFQVTALNDLGQHNNPPMYFQQRRPVSQGDTGEYWTDANGNTMMAFNGLDGRDITEEGQRLTGDTNFVIENGRFEQGNGLETINSVQDLSNTLQEMKSQGRLPAIMVVNAYDPIFGVSNQPGAQPNHVVCIDDYDPASGRVFVDNQWGSGSDGWVNINDLYRASV